MKADRWGTFTEQQRARRGWLAPSERRANGVPEGRTCRRSCYSQYPDRGSLGCRHPKGSFATAPGASCDFHTPRDLEVPDA